MYGTMYGTMARMLKTTVYLTPELKACLARLSAEQGRSEADLIRAALETLTTAERPRPRFPLINSGDRATNISERVDEILAEGFGED